MSATDRTHMPATIKNITFEMLKFGAVGILPGKTMIDSLTYEELWDERLKQMLGSLRAKVLAHNLEEHTRTVSLPVTFEYSATWWQMLKRDHFPPWLLTRFPVRYKTETKTRRRTVTFKKYATYPEANLALPQQTFGFPVYHSMIAEEDDAQA